MRLLAFLLILAASPAAAINPAEMFDDPAEEARARDIGRDLRCLVCRNQSIFDSNAGLAQDLRTVVRERMIEGDTDAEVLAYVRERFGDYVLLDPPVSGHTYALWAAPVAFALFALFGGWAYMRSRPTALPDDMEVPE